MYHVNPLGELDTNVKNEEIKWNSYLKQRYEVLEKFKILKLPHALQDDSISCGVFCIKFAENFINEEGLLQSFSLKELDKYRKEVVHFLLDKGGQEHWNKTVCRICGQPEGPKKNKNQRIDKWIKCDICKPVRWFHQACILYVKEKKKFVYMLKDFYLKE
ncbi:uncharacterized protein LOC136084248 [Hydra vulgaris]|uniref:Uncharacterized protein LOC136084248 n=1 Tax=Hydra vulgaris TaxID=6087 RepID=A0ABM4CFD9_HYDVU